MLCVYIVQLSGGLFGFWHLLGSLIVYAQCYSWTDANRNKRVRAKIANVQNSERKLIHAMAQQTMQSDS